MKNNAFYLTLLIMTETSLLEGKVCTKEEEKELYILLYFSSWKSL